jgi:hypothetical protein
MKANELRIGNWISDRGMKEWQIDSWERKNKVAAKSPIFKFGDLAMEGHPLTEEVDFLIPIPLTEEWLLKFGFKPLQKDWQKKGLIIHTRKRGFIVRKSIPQIHHVHQLQNLYFALTGEELVLSN